MFKNSLRDFSNNKQQQHATADTHADIVATAVETVTVRAAELAIESSLPFVTLLFAIMAVTYYRPQIYCAREFYKNCFNNCWYHGPPRKWAYDLVWVLMDALSVGAMVQYLFTFASHEAGVAASYYMSVVAIYIAYLAFRHFWINSFWNYHNKKAFLEGETVYSWEVSVALGFAFVFVILAWIALIVLLALFGRQGDWIAFGLLFVPTLWVTLIAIWTIAVFNCVPKAPTCGKKTKQCAI